MRRVLRGCWLAMALLAGRGRVRPVKGGARPDQDPASGGHHRARRAEVGKVASLQQQLQQASAQSTPSAGPPGGRSGVAGRTVTTRHPAWSPSSVRRFADPGPARDRGTEGRPGTDDRPQLDENNLIP